MMYILKRPKNIFIAISLAVTLLIAAFIPFFSELSQGVSIVNLFLGQLALIALYILAVFPRADNNQLIKLSAAYAIFLSICFLTLSLLPFEKADKLFFILDYNQLPILVSVDIPTIVFINIAATIFMGLGFHLKKHNPADEYKLRNQESLNEQASSLKEEINKAAHASDDSKSALEIVEQAEKEQVKSSLLSVNYEEEDSNENLPNLKINSMKEAQDELKSEISNMFSSYLSDAEEIESSKLDEQNKFEKALIKNLDTRINEALCINADGNAINTNIIRWNDIDGKEIQHLFQRSGNYASELNTGRLCQMLINNKKRWYIISRYKKNFLILKTMDNDPSPLLETSFKVLQTLQKS